MSFSDGWAALNLEKTARVPRTEYSAHEHWPLISSVTGMQVSVHSTELDRLKAQQAFFRAWNYDFFWNILINGDIFADKRTFMGHAAYADGSVDYNPETSSYFRDYEEVLRFDPQAEYEPPRLDEWKQRFDSDYDKMTNFVPDALNMTGIYVSCISGMIEMFGWELLLEACGYDPAGFGQVIHRYTDYILPYFQAAALSKAPVLMVHDDFVWTSGAIFRRSFYDEFVFPNLKRCIEPMLDAGKKVLFTCDGDYSDFIADVAGMGVHGFVMEPATNMRQVAQRYGKTHVFVGNADTRVLLMGSREDIENEVKRCMDIGKECNGFFMAVGNHIPANTPVESALFYNECYEKLSRR